MTQILHNKWNATKITQQHAYLLLEKHKSVSCSLQNLEENWSAIIFMPVKMTQKWGPGGESSLKLQYRALRMTTAASLPSWVVQEWISKGRFPQELHPWVLAPQGEADRTGAPDMGLPGCPLWGEQSSCLTCAVKGKNGSRIIDYFTVTQSKVLDYFRELREPLSRLKGYFFCEEWEKKASKICSHFYVRKGNSTGKGSSYQFIFVGDCIVIYLF